VPHKKTLRILLVDDDATDRELFSEALQSVAPQHQLSEASNGEEALQVLAAADPLPDLILLDLNMPVKDGRETLLDIRSDPRLRCIPVCILSTSSAHFDVQKAYNDGANIFLVKPLEFAVLTGLIEMLGTLFTKFAALP
jgi:two-component system, chemotaxis family, response regulator Rcp1